VLKSGLAYVHVSAASLCTNVNMELHARDFLIVFSFYRFLLHVLGKKVTALFDTQPACISMPGSLIFN